jgi:hypothetical protein
MQDRPLPKKDYWKDPKVLADHAKRRREKYAHDPEVAKAEKQRQRKLYAARRGDRFTNTARDALNKGLTEKQYSAEEISRILGRASGYVARLIARGLWPDPRPDQSGPCLFTGEETNRLDSSFADHIDNVASTYRADHVETTAALFAALGRTPPTTRS